MVGMTLDEFWYGDPELYFNYLRVYENKAKYEQQKIWQIDHRGYPAVCGADVCVYVHAVAGEGYS